MRMDGKVALVVGGSSGIGRAAAMAFAAAGASVMVASRRVEEGRETVAHIEESGGAADFVKTDVSNEGEIAALVTATTDRFGRLDYAFNNAGIEGETVAVTEAKAETFDDVFGINVRGTMLCMKHQIPAMRKSGGGAIVNMSSMVGHVAFADYSIYVASKHAVIGLTKAVALEEARRGIRVNAVSPGAVATAMMERLTGHSDEQAAWFADQHPMGRFATSDEVAKSVLFLCSDDASFITGQSLVVDGGYTAK